MIWLSVSILFIITLWAFAFYFNMLDEIKESVDEGLEHYKRQIIHRAQKDTAFLNGNIFNRGSFAILESAAPPPAEDRHLDTLMYMQDADDKNLELEPVRMLVTGFARDGHFYELKIFNSMLEEDDLINELLWDAVWLYIILIAGIVVINNVILQRLWRPFYSFLNQLKNYRLGNSKNLPALRTRTREFADLQNAVSILLKRSTETYEQQKEFIGNASHELQTPLAIAISKLELLLERGNLENSQAATISGVLDMIERLVRLNKSLLLLTKIENKQFLDNQTVCLNKLLRQHMSELEEIAEFKSVKIEVAESDDLCVEMDVSLAAILTSNLLRNAIFHNIPGGTVHITISENTFTISNTGISRSLNAEKIFTRFYQAGSGQSGTGLGLAIVMAICKLYGFTASYSFKHSRHCFEIRVNNRSA
jgi:signal transduction histidine kinase